MPCRQRLFGKSRTGPAYESPILDDVARRACAELVLAGPRGMTVRALADATGANAKTVYHLLRGASVEYDTRLFVRVGRLRRKGRPNRWTVRSCER
jgi:hypothetical protein